jgi:hypothetical protein
MVGYGLRFWFQLFRAQLEMANNERLEYSVVDWKHKCYLMKFGIKRYIGDRARARPLTTLATLFRVARFSGRHSAKWACALGQNWPLIFT